MTNRNLADLSLDASWIFPVLPRGRLFKDCSLLIKGDTIIGIEPTASVAERYEVKQRLNLDQQLLMPGLINCHGHAAMSLLRGYADDLPLQTWLEEHIWPTESHSVNEQFVYDGTRLAIAEMLLSGTTCFSDMYFYPESSAKAAHESGMRAHIMFPVMDAANNWARDADDALHKGLTLRDVFRSQALIDVGFGPHAPYTISDGVLKRIATYAEELQAPVQIHLHETEQEVQQSLETYGVRPIERLHNLGLLGPLTQCVHMTQLQPQDQALLEATGAHVIHCPQSNMKLASGSCKVQALLDAEVNVALGTDGAASNNDLNMFAELQTAALLGKLVANNPAALNTQTTLELATINGAKAMGIDDKVGSLEKGKQADVIAVDFSSLQAQPTFNPLSQLIYTGIGQAVRHSWVAGRQLVDNFQLTAMNTDELSAAGQRWQQHIHSQGSTPR